ncbi:FAD-dependent oxidoreductase [Janibacter sp. GS2]|uniref:FAD-dependent oxidoreductase n=1 Tax=Janibacter sp. GS2 TaxID=3442646 RepID=UPI003EC00D1B
MACPVNCIHPAPGEPGFGTTEMLYIDAQTCVDCGACVTACPVDAIKPLPSLLTHEQSFTELSRAYYAENPHQDRTPMAKVKGQRRLRDQQRALRAAVVGAGPAGMFTADELLTHPEVEAVDVFDRQPTPYGLARAGVAPDHGRTKRVERLFSAIEDDPRLTYRLGVEVGRDVTDEELSRFYDVVIYTVGAASDRRVGVPGEDLPGSTSATRFVSWYNAHPEAHQSFELDHERVVVVGNGNVALDVARILTADPDQLAGTDIADEALGAMYSSSVREVVLLGRRGPAQAAFTVPELIGLSAVEGIDVEVDAPAAELRGDDPRTRLLADLAARPARGTGRRIVLRFLSAPVRYTGTERVTGVDVTRTRLVPDGSGRLTAVPTGEVEHVAAGLVLRSVGYRGTPVAGLPFDEATGTVPHAKGRVRPGRYVAGWIKRGPRGFIGTNRSCAQETVESILDDLDAELVSEPSATSADLTQLLRSRGVVPVDRTGWHRIDAAERRRGHGRGAERSKIVDAAELMDVARW